LACSSTHTSPIATLFPYTTLFRSELAVEFGCDPGPLNGADILEIRDRACARATDSGEALRQAEARLVRIEREALERSMLVSGARDRKSTRLNSSHQIISYAVFCLK